MTGMTSSLTGVGVRSLLLRGLWCDTVRLGFGWTYSLAPALTRFYPDPDRLRSALERHLSAFGTHPICAGLLLGMAVAQEERLAAVEPLSVATESFRAEAMRRHLSAPLAALGVTLVNGAWQPAVSALAVGTYYLSDGGMRYSPWWAVGLVLAAFTLPSVVLRVGSVHLGYRRQESLVGWLAGLDPQMWIRVGRVAGLIGLVGAGLSYLITAPEPWWMLASLWALAAAATRLGVRGGWVIGSAVGLAAAYEAGRLAMAP